MTADPKQNQGQGAFGRGNGGGKKKRWLSLILRLGLGGTFVWAAWHKIASPADFALILYGYGIFPKVMINILALWVPFIELLSGICLITGGYRMLSKEAGLMVINLLLVCFIAIIGFNLIRGHAFDCGCFSLESGTGGDAKTSAVLLLIRDFVLLGAGGWLWMMFRWHSLSEQQGSEHADNSES